MGLIVSKLEKTPALMEEFLFLIMNTMGNFIGNYIEVADILLFFDGPEMMNRCEASLQRHISARKRAFRSELRKYQENHRNCQCQVCMTRAMCNINEMQEYWIHFEEVLHNMCENETMEIEAVTLMGILIDFYFSLQFDLPICCRRKDKNSVIRKSIEEDLLQPLRVLLEKGKKEKKKAEPSKMTQGTKSFELPKTSESKSPPRHDKRKKQRSNISLSPTCGLPKAPQSTSPRKFQISAGDPTPSTSQMFMQEERDVELDPAAEEEPSEVVLKMVKKGGVYIPANFDDLPDELKSVFRRIEEAAKIMADAPPSTPKSPVKSPKPKKTTKVLRDPVLIIPPPPQKKIQVIPQEVQEAMDVFPKMHHHSLSSQPSSVRLTEPDPERIKLEDLMASGSFKKHKQPENPFKLTQKRQAERVKLSHALHRSSSIEKLPSEFPDDEPIMPFKLQPPQPKSPPGAKQPDTTKLLKDELDKTTIGKKLFETVFGVQDDDKIFKLEELMKLEQEPQSAPIPKETQREEEKISFDQNDEKDVSEYSDEDEEEETSYDEELEEDTPPDSPKTPPPGGSDSGSYFTAVSSTTTISSHKKDKINKGDDVVEKESKDTSTLKYNLLDIFKKPSQFNPWKSKSQAGHSISKISKPSASRKFRFPPNRKLPSILPLFQQYPTIAEDPTSEDFENEQKLMMEQTKKKRD
nr:uncharacterized protein LOC111425616 isoform X2 [Onthophagus taurus]